MCTTARLQGVKKSCCTSFKIDLKHVTEQLTRDRAHLLCYSLKEYFKHLQPKNQTTQSTH